MDFVNGSRRFADLGEALGMMGADVCQPYDDDRTAVPVLAMTAVLHANPDTQNGDWKVVYGVFPEFQGSQAAMLRALANDLMELANSAPDDPAPATH